MKLFGRIMRCLCYAGVISNGIGMLVCVLNSDWSNYSGCAFLLAVWIGNYLYHRCIEKTW